MSVLYVCMYVLLLVWYIRFILFHLEKARDYLLFHTFHISFIIHYSPVKKICTGFEM